MHNKNSSNYNFLIGAMIGSVVVGASAVFMTSRRGRDLKKTAEYKMRDMKGKLDDLVDILSDKGGEVQEQIGEKTSEYSQKIHDFAANLIDQIDVGENYKEKIAPLVIGGLVGVAVGIGAVSLFSGDLAKKGYLKSLSESFPISDVLGDVLSLLEKDGQKVAKKGEHMAHDVLELVSSGAHLWQKLKKAG